MFLKSGRTQHTVRNNHRRNLCWMRPRVWHRRRPTRKFVWANWVSRNQFQRGRCIGRSWNSGRIVGWWGQQQWLRLCWCIHANLILLHTSQKIKKNNKSYEETIFHRWARTFICFPSFCVCYRFQEILEYYWSNINVYIQLWFWLIRRWDCVFVAAENRDLKFDDAGTCLCRSIALVSYILDNQEISIEK